MSSGYKNKSNKILSIMFVLILLTTTIFPVVNSLEIKNEAANTVINNIKETVEEKITDLKEKNIFKTNDDKAINFSNLRETIVDTLNTLVDFVIGNSSLNLYTKYNGLEKYSKLRLFTPCKIDVNNDGNDDIKATLLIYPFIEKSLSLSLNFRISIERLENFDDINADFEAYAELTMPGLLYPENKEDIVRYGYHSENGEEVPDKCIVTYVFIPNILSSKKPEIKISLNPENSANKDKLSLVYSKTEVNNSLIVKENILKVTYEPAVKADVYVDINTEEGYKLRYKMQTSSETKVTIYHISGNQSEIDTDWGLYIEKMPKLFEFEVGIEKLEEGGLKFGYDLLSDESVDAMFFRKNGVFSSLGFPYFYVKSIPNHASISCSLRKTGFIEMNKYGQTESEVGWTDSLYNGNQKIYFGNLPSGGRINWNLSFIDKSSIDIFVDTEGTSLNGYLKGENGGYIDFEITCTNNIDVAASWDISSGYFNLDRSGSSININLSIHTEQIDLLELSATLNNFGGNPFTIDGSGLLAGSLDPRVVIESGGNVEITRFYLNLNEFNIGNLLVNDFEADLRDIHFDIDQDKTRKGSITFVPSLPGVYQHLEEEGSLLDSMYISISVTSHCSLSIGSCDIDIVSETVLLPTVNVTNLKLGQVIRGIYTIRGTAKSGDSSRPVQSVQVKIGNGLWEDAIGTTSWSYTWDTTEYPDGDKYTVEVRSYDGTYYSLSEEIKKIKIDNIISPSITITYPEKGDTIDDVVTITGTAIPGDPSRRPIALVQVGIPATWETLKRGTWENATGTTSWSYVLDIKNLPNDNYTIIVRCFDTEGYEARNSTYVFVDNGPEYNIPTVTIDNSSFDFRESGVVTIRGSASPGYSARPVEQVQLLLLPNYIANIQRLILNITQGIPLSEATIDIILEGEWINVTGTTDWSYEWDTSDIPFGLCSIYARSYDGLYYSVWDQAAVLINNINVSLIEDSFVIDIYRSRGTSVDITNFNLKLEHTKLDGNKTTITGSFDKLTWDSSPKASKSTLIIDKINRSIQVTKDKNGGILQIDNILIEISEDVEFRVNKLIFNKSYTNHHIFKAQLFKNNINSHNFSFRCRLELSFGVEMFGIYARFNNRVFYKPDLHLIGPIVFELGLEISAQNVTWNIAQDGSWGWIQIGGNGHLYFNLDARFEISDHCRIYLSGMLYFGSEENEGLNISWENLFTEDRIFRIHSNGMLDVSGLRFELQTNIDVDGFGLLDDFNTIINLSIDKLSFSSEGNFMLDLVKDDLSISSDSNKNKKSEFDLEFDIALGIRHLFSIDFRGQFSRHSEGEVDTELNLHSNLMLDDMKALTIDLKRDYNYSSEFSLKNLHLGVSLFEVISFQTGLASFVGTVEKGPGSMVLSLNVTNADSATDISFSFYTSKSRSSATHLNGLYFKVGGGIEFGWQAFELERNSDFLFSINVHNVEALIEAMQDPENASEILENFSGGFFILFEGNNQFSFTELYLKGGGKIQDFKLSGNFDLNSSASHRTRLLFGVDFETKRIEFILSRHAGLHISDFSLGITAKRNGSTTKINALIESLSRQGGFHLRICGSAKAINNFYFVATNSHSSNLNVKGLYLDITGPKRNTLLLSGEFDLSRSRGLRLKFFIDPDDFYASLRINSIGGELIIRDATIGIGNESGTLVIPLAYMKVGGYIKIYLDLILDRTKSGLIEKIDYAKVNLDTNGYWDIQGLSVYYEESSIFDIFLKPQNPVIASNVGSLEIVPRDKTIDIYPHRTKEFLNIVILKGHSENTLNIEYSRNDYFFFYLNHTKYKTRLDFDIELLDTHLVGQDVYRSHAFTLYADAEENYIEMLHTGYFEASRLEIEVGGNSLYDKSMPEYAEGGDAGYGSPVLSDLPDDPIWAKLTLLEGRTNGSQYIKIDLENQVIDANWNRKGSWDLLSLETKGFKFKTEGPQGLYGDLKIKWEGSDEITGTKIDITKISRVEITTQNGIHGYFGLISVIYKDTQKILSLSGVEGGLSGSLVIDNIEWSTISSGIIMRALVASDPVLPVETGGETDYGRVLLKAHFYFDDCSIKGAVSLFGKLHLKLGATLNGDLLFETDKDKTFKRFTSISGIDLNIQRFDIDGVIIAEIDGSIERGSSFEIKKSSFYKTLTILVDGKCSINRLKIAEEGENSELTLDLFEANEAEITFRKIDDARLEMFLSGSLNILGLNYNGPIFYISGSFIEYSGDILLEIWSPDEGAFYCDWFTTDVFESKLGFDSIKFGGIDLVISGELKVRNTPSDELHSFSVDVHGNANQENWSIFTADLGTKNDPAIEHCDIQFTINDRGFKVVRDNIWADGFWVIWSPLSDVGWSMPIEDHIGADKDQQPLIYTKSGSGEPWVQIWPRSELNIQLYGGEGFSLPVNEGEYFGVKVDMFGVALRGADVTYEKQVEETGAWEYVSESETGADGKTPIAFEGVDFGEEDEYDFNGDGSIECKITVVYDGPVLGHLEGELIFDVVKGFPPIAVWGGGTSCTEDEPTISVNALKSSDPDGYITAAKWEWKDNKDNWQTTGWKDDLKATLDFSSIFNDEVSVTETPQNMYTLSTMSTSSISTGLNGISYAAIDNEESTGIIGTIDSETVTVILTVKDNDGLTGSVSQDVQLYSNPDTGYFSISIEDNNGNGVVERGEKFYVTVTDKDTGAPIKDASVTYQWCNSGNWVDAYPILYPYGKDTDENGEVRYTALLAYSNEQQTGEGSVALSSSVVTLDAAPDPNEDMGDSVKSRVVVTKSGYHTRYRNFYVYERINENPETTNCFLAGTKILMADGSLKNIEDIQKGDKVKSHDVKNDEWKTGNVTQVFHHDPEEMGSYYLVLNDDLRVTPNHPIYVNDKWITADELKLGDVFGGNKITSIEKKYEQVPTYNFEVDFYHTYTVVWGDAYESIVHNDATPEPVQEDTGGITSDKNPVITPVTSPTPSTTNFSDDQYFNIAF